MNKVFLIGRLTKDIDFRRTQNGTSVASFTLAVNDMVKKDQTDFITCVAWKGTADAMHSYVKKGQKIAVSGKIKVRTYDSKGQKHWVTEVHCDEVEFLEKKDQSVFEEPKPAQPDFALLDGDDSELPF